METRRDRPSLPGVRGYGNVTKLKRGTSRGKVNEEVSWLSETPEIFCVYPILKG